MARLSLKDDFNGVYPQGPFSLYPIRRQKQLWADKDKALIIVDDLSPEEKGEMEMQRANVQRGLLRKGIKPNAFQMGKGLMKAAGQAIVHGKVSEEIRNERYDTCKNCPFFIPESKRCSECGCFMEAKTWIGGNPDTLCPKQKWSR